MVHAICAIYIIYVIFGHFLVIFVIYGKTGAYDMYHMAVIYVLIWVLIEASGSQECSPAFETCSKKYFQRKKGKNIAA